MHTRLHPTRVNETSEGRGGGEGVRPGGGVRVRRGGVRVRRGGVRVRRNFLVN